MPLTDAPRPVSPRAQAPSRRHARRLPWLGLLCAFALPLATADSARAADDNDCPPGYSPGSLEQQGAVNRGCLIDGYEPGDERCSQSAAGQQAGLPPCLTSRRSGGDAAQARLITVRASGVLRVGAFLPRRDPTLGAAKSALGTPKQVINLGGGSCKVRWPKLGLEMLFSSSGVAGQSCKLDKAEAQYAVLSGSHARTWRTDKGLRVGHSRQSVLKKYAQAKRGKSIYTPRPSKGLVYELLRGRQVGQRVTWLAAAMQRGKVGSLELYIGQAGQR